MYHASNIQLNLKFIDLETQQPNLLFEDQDFTISSSIIKSSTGECSSIYFFEMKDRAGTLLIEKCKQLKVPPGPLFAKLKSGNEIEVDGRIIRPSDVLGPTEVGPTFAIVDCPTQAFIPSLIEKGNFSNFTKEKCLEFVVHVSSKEVHQDFRYQEWLKQFQPSTKHILLGKHGQNELSLASSSVFQVKLNCLNKDVFKILKENQMENYRLLESEIIENCPTMLTYNLRPLRSKGITFEPQLCHLDTKTIKEESLNLIDDKLFRDYVSTLKKACSDEEFKPNVLFLGTGSATPGKLRNTSAILLNFEPGKSMLFDCGEATFLQLNRFYGQENIDSILSSIKAIFISHIHADHHFGLVRLLMERSRLNLDPVILIAPNQIRLFLEQFSSVVGDLSSLYQFTTCNSMLFGGQLKEEALAIKQKLCALLSLEDLVTVEVPHCYDSHGIVVNYRQKKIAYSGDSMFSNAFDEAAKDCLLLIHEATMNDDLIEEAKLKRHSTISEAINVGHNIGAQFTLLTHFSQRYAKIAPINLIEDQSLSAYIEDHVGIAFDFMNVNLDQISQVTKLKPILEKLFVEEIQELQEIRTKRATKRKVISDYLEQQQQLKF